MHPAINSPEMGNGLIQDSFGGAIRKAFPDASEAELYGAGMIFKEDGGIVLTLKGVEVSLV